MTVAAPRRRLRVVAVSPCGPWRITDGSALVLHHHLQRLGPRHDITLLTVETPPTGYELPGVDIRVFDRHVLPAGVGYAMRRVRAVVSGEPAHAYYAGRRDLLREFGRCVSQEVDVLHLFGWGTAQLVAQAPQVPALHVAVDEWIVGHRNRVLPGWRRLADVGEGRAVVRHERRWYPRQGAVVLVAESDAESLRRAGPGARCEVAPNGVELGLPPAPPAAEPVLVFHGALSVQANIDAAVHLVREVLPLVQEEVPEARAGLVGRDPDPTVRRLAAADVVVTGEGPDIRDALAQGAVYVAPLVSGTGLKNKVLEAMAAGLAVVATTKALGGIGPGPGVVAADTSADLAAAAVALLRDPAGRAAAGQQARARAGDFSWDASADRIEALWQELTAPRHARPG